jgi:signal transduction histidine kinase
LTTLALTLLGVAWFFGRTVVRPLSATHQAARQIAAGNLDVAVPSSRVREVAEVNTAFVAMSDALRESITHQATMEQERRLFIGAVVHDLRTPLFSLRGYLEGFAKGLANTPEKQARYLAIAQERTAALERLVSDLFDFARLEYLEQGARRAPLDLVSLIQRAIEAARPRSEAKEIEVHLVAPPSPAPITGDEHLLARALENVLDNALRHTPTGGRVVLTYTATATEVAVSVADNGPGIPAEDLPHLFTPLFRGEKSRNRHTGGAGLGLTIAQRIFRDHGGDLTVHNAPGGGAVFTGKIQRESSSATATSGLDDRQSGYPTSARIASTATSIGVSSPLAHAASKTSTPQAIRRSDRHSA